MTMKIWREIKTDREKAGSDADGGKTLGKDQGKSE